MANLEEEKQLETESKSVNPFSRRWILSYVGFLGFVFLYATRVNIAVAIICMVKSSVSNNTQSTSNDTVDELDIVEEACGGLEQSLTGVQRGEFDWDKPTRSRVLAMYFYGYIFTQIPGGWLAGRFGGKRVWGVGMFVNGLGTLLTPVSARVHINLLYAVRFIIGFAAGVSFPATHAMWGRWAPRLERSKLMAVCYSGIGNMVWVGLWVLLSADNPRTHRFISLSEVLHIEKNIGYNPESSNKSTPWLAMAKSGPLWAIIIAHMCNNWTNYTLITVLPTFMKEVLKYDIKQNGAISSIPYVIHVVFSMISGQIADYVRANTRLGTTRVRKIGQAMTFLTVAAALVGTGYVRCENRVIAIVLLCVAVGFMGVSKAGYVVNHVDIAPRHAGVLFGITNTVATIPGMVAPLVAGALTPNKTAEEWRIVLFICAGFLVFGAIVFTCLASGETQAWNDHRDINREVKKDKNKEYVPVQELDTTPAEKHEP